MELSLRPRDLTGKAKVTANGKEIFNIICKKLMASGITLIFINTLKCKVVQENVLYFSM